MPKQKFNWILDAVLFIGFLMTFFLDWTGLDWHQWLGVGIGAAAVYHLLVHWKWVAAVTQRLFSKTSQQSRLYYILDWSILLGFLVIGFSGLWISTWLNLELDNYLIWKELHIYSSIISLALIMIKIAAHWRWIVKTASKYFGLWKSPLPASVSPGAKISAQPGSLNRRDFLQLMGVAGLASLLSAANLVDFGKAAGEMIVEDQTTSPEVNDSGVEIQTQEIQSCQVICDQGCTYPGKCRRYIDQNQNGICDLTECQTSETTELTTTDNEYSPDEGEEATLPETDPSVEINSGEGECVVQCPKGCSYPGDCHNYVDLNGNNLCDLGECLDSDTAAEAVSTEHSGGGRRRRGKQ